MKSPINVLVVSSTSRDLSLKTLGLCLVFSLLLKRPKGRLGASDLEKLGLCLVLSLLRPHLLLQKTRTSGNDLIFL